MTSVRPRRVCTAWFLGCILAFGCGNLPWSNAATPEKQTQEQVVHSLNPKHATAVQRIGPDVRNVEKRKFVQIEVTKIVNPAKTAVLFNVYFQPEKGGKVFLGTFSPYPPDRAGKFIVPTKGKLKHGGTVILSMELPDGAPSAAPLDVQVRKFAFREE